MRGNRHAMKTRVVALAFGLALCVPSLADAPRGTQSDTPEKTEPRVTIAIPNADLEEGKDGPSRWHFSHGEGATGNWSWDTQDVHGGKRAFRLRKETSQG